MAKKLGLVLGAGGSRGVAHVGFLKALEEAGIIPDYITGSSMGSVIGSCYSIGMSPEKMIEEINKLKLSQLFDLSFNPVGNGALLRAKKMRSKLYTYLTNRTFEHTKIPFKCVAVDLISGKTKLFEGKEKLLDGVVASSSIPGIFKPVAYKDMLLVDGGVTTRVPVQEVRDMGAEVVVAVDVLGDAKPTVKKYHIASVVLRVADIYDSEITKYKMQVLKPDLYLVPNLGTMSQYKLDRIDFAIEEGYRLGKQSVGKIKELVGA